MRSADEIQFRDGWRVVPPHVAAMLAGIETHTLTYEEAIRKADEQRLGDVLFKAQRSMIDTHFKDMK